MRLLRSPVVQLVVLIIALLGAAVGLAVLVGGSAAGAVVFLVLTLGAFTLTLRADQVIFRMLGARQVHSGTAPELSVLAGQLARQVGLPKPALAFFDGPQANALVTVRGQSGTLLLSRSMLQAMTREEAEVLVALMIKQLQHPRMRAAQIAAALGAFGTTLGGLVLLVPPGRLSGPPGRAARCLASATAPIAALIVRGLARPPVALEADTETADLTGNGLSLARALMRLDALARGQMNVAVERHPAIAHMFLVDPMPASPLRARFDTHIPVEIRATRLKAPVDAGEDTDL